jgi:hypothetical protein
MLWIDTDATPTGGGGGGGGTGDVAGPATATDNAIARFDTTTGKLIQNSGVTIDDTGFMTITAASGPDSGGLLLQATTPGIFTNNISETTNNTGVTIDGVLIKDGLVDGVDVSTLSGGGGGSASIAMGKSPGDSVSQVGAPQQWFATLHTATNTQDITTLQSFCVNVSGSNVVQLGIYNDSGTLLSSGTATVTTTGKFSVTLGSTVAVTKGNNYWLALCNQTNTAGTNFPYFQGNGNSTLVNRYAGGASLPSTLPAGNTTATAFCIMAI